MNTNFEQQLTFGYSVMVKLLFLDVLKTFWKYYRINNIRNNVRLIEGVAATGIMLAVVIPIRILFIPYKEFNNAV